MAERNLAPVAIRGHLTSAPLAADSCENQEFKAKYKTGEAELAAKTIEARPGRAPVLAPTEASYLVALQREHLLSCKKNKTSTQRQFLGCGATVAFDGAQGALMRERPEGFWGRGDISAWRENYLRDLRSGAVRKSADVYELIDFR